MIPSQKADPGVTKPALGVITTKPATAKLAKLADTPLQNISFFVKIRSRTFEDRDCKSATQTGKEVYE